jgi:uncharacterized protein
MDGPTFAGFDWDEGNVEKCQKHGVSIGEIEALLLSEPATYPDALHSSDEERWQAIGRTAAGRAIFVVFTFRDDGDGQWIRPIGARYMHAKEVQNYERSHET